ncbi:MAG: carboxypeptidase-like regulatory domain-containing protein, partial [Bacteroidales bacterium]
MKPALVFIWLVLSGSSLQSGGPDKVISCHFRNISFTEFCNEVLRQADVKIYYKDAWVNDLKANLDTDSITVLSAVKQVIEGSGLELSVWKNDLVLLPGKKLLADLPLFEQKADPNPVVKQEEQLVTESEERYITGRIPEVTQAITIGHPGINVGNSRVKVSGRVLDYETGEPINYVSFYISETKNGVVSDLTGFFTLALFPGKYNVQIQLIGYETEKYLLDVLSAGSLNVRMKKKAFQMNEVVVNGERQSDIRIKDPGLDKISIKSIRSLPMMMGDRDILKVSGTLPGIVSVGEGNAGLNVRGGGFDQNALYINRIPVYNTSHMFGFFPSFNSDIVKDFSIYKGHIPAEYGGRLASVFNITTRQGNRKRFTAHGSLSPVIGNIVLEGPLKKDTASFILSARTSYSDLLLSMIKDSTIKASRANFNDLSGGVNWDFKNTQASLFVYHSYDHFRLSTINTYDYSNSGASLILGHTFRKSLRGELALVGSGYNFSTVDKLQISSAYQHSYEMNHYEMRAAFK